MSSVEITALKLWKSKIKNWNSDLQIFSELKLYYKIMLQIGNSGFQLLFYQSWLELIEKQAQPLGALQQKKNPFYH